MRRTATVCLLTILAGAAPAGLPPAALGDAAGDSLRVTTGEVASGFWFRGRPGPDCESFAVTEFALLFRADDPPGYEPGEVSSRYLLWQLGGMRNLSAHDALGLVILAGGTEYTWHGGLTVRYRRWLSRDVALDAAPGILGVGSGTRPDLLYPSFVLNAGLSYAELFGLTAQMVIERPEHDDPDVGFYLGIKAGSYPGAVLGLALPAAVGIGELASGAEDPPAGDGRVYAVPAGR